MEDPVNNIESIAANVAESQTQTPVSATTDTSAGNVARNNNTNANNTNRRRRQNRRGLNRNNLRSREGFFMHYLFITLSVRYANFFKPTVRRMIEFITLIKAIMMLTILIYIHMTFVKEPGSCLGHVEDIWPSSGVLKVQVEANTTLPQYQFFFAKANSDNWATSFEMDPYQAVFKYSVPFSKDGIGGGRNIQQVTPYNKLKRLKESFGMKEVQQCPIFDSPQFMKSKARQLLMKRFNETTPDIEFLHALDKEDIPHWILVDDSISDTYAEKQMLQMQEVIGSGFNMGLQPVRTYYAIEYSAEFGYLRLPAVTRHKLGIPVLVVTLDPKRDACFGIGLKRWMLDTFFGYDDLVMTSIKQLAEKEHKQGGYLRNLVTGEHYKFITLWVSNASYLLAFTVMLVFTLVVTMLLRYSYHQIFVFMVELLHILDTDATPIFPAAPMLTIILALVGTEEIMTEFFHDSTLAFYVILSIWIADQFDAICMHTFISRRHWVRFFFLYHFAFYAYHYRFNGQFSELALFTSWLFIQHSMFYFVHHYEIPAIQRQIRLRQILLQNNRNEQNSPPAPPTTEPQTTTPTQEPVTPQDNNNAPEESSSRNGDSPNSEGPSPPQSGGSTTENLLMINSYDSSYKMLLSTSSDTITEFENEIADADNFGDAKITETVELWENFPSVLENDTILARNMEQSNVGISKYCNLLIMLFFVVLSFILVFSLTILMLNQGKFGPRSTVNDFDKVASLVR